jgi:hypothetical protein
MSSNQRAWWPAIPHGGQIHPSGKNQDNETSSYWSSVQHDLSGALPRALPEHIQAQKACPTAKRLPKPWSAEHAQDSDTSELTAANHVQHAKQPEPQKAISIHPDCCNATSPQLTNQAAQQCSTGKHTSALSQQDCSPVARQAHAVYAALFLSSEQQGLLLNRQDQQHVE